MMNTITRESKKTSEEEEDVRVFVVDEEDVDSDGDDSTIYQFIDKEGIRRK